MKSNLKANAKHVLSKIPEITLIFWIIKVMGTTIGETAADFLSTNFHLGLTITSIIMGALLLVSLFVQVSHKKYVPWIYWLSVVLISIVGTLITDNLVDNFGIPLLTTTIIFGICLLITFIAWFISEKTLSIHSIFTKKRELFYWAAILFTFALGTAGGDLTAEGLHLGYAVSAIGFAAIIGIVAAGFYLFKLNAVLSFWIAYILTRPLGATCGDLLTQPVSEGGLGLGNGTINLIYISAIAVLVIYLTISHKKHNKIAQNHEKVVLENNAEI